MLNSQSSLATDGLAVSNSDVERDETKRILQNAINSLPNVHKSVIILKYLEGLSYENMAKVLDCPVGTIRSRLYNAKEQLKEKLRDLIGGGRS